jgi:hypothetical protein
MKQTILEDIERMNRITKYIIPKTIERDDNDMDDMRNLPKKKSNYRGFTIEKDWLGTFSTEVNGEYFKSNKDWKVKEFIDDKLNGRPD